MAKLPDPLKKPISFRPTDRVMESECMTYLQKNLLDSHNRNDWINKACMFYYDYEQYKKGFIIRLMDQHFEYCKHVLRQLGNARKKLKEKYG